MAINFPHNPNVNDVHTEASLGRSWKWDGTSWSIYSSTTTGIAFGDLSVSQQAASGSGSLTYNNAGVFTYTPPAGGGGGGSSTFTGLSDTPSSLTAGKWLKVNVGGTALEWTDAPAGANTTYDLTASDGSVATEEKILLTGSDSSEDAVTLAVSGNLSIARSNNTITFGSSVPTTITVADESTETVCYPLFTTTATGNLAPKTGSNIKFNSQSGELEAGSFKKTGGAAAEFLKADGSIDSTTYLSSVALNDLSDVTTGTISDGDVLKYSGTNSRWEAQTDATGGGGGATTLGALTDVDTTGAVNNKILKYNGTSWVVADDATGGGGGSSNFTGLSDTPGTLTAGKWLKVNAGATALEWTDAPSGSDTTYDLITDAVTDGGIIRLTGSDSTTNDVQVLGGTNITVSRSADHKLTINSDITNLNSLSDVTISGSVGDDSILQYDTTDSKWKPANLPTSGNTTYTLSAVQGGTSVNIRLSGSDSTDDNVLLTPGTGLSLDSITADGFTIKSTDTIDSVTGRGATTNNDVTFGSLTCNNLTVNGTTTTVNSNTVNIGDSNLTLNSDETGAPSQDGGLTIERGTSTNVEIRWNETSDKWQFTNDGTNYSNIGSSSAGTFISLTGTPSSYSDGKYLKSSATALEWTDPLTYDMTTAAVTGGGIIRLENELDNTTDDIQILGGTNITVSRSADHKLTIANSITNLTSLSDVTISGSPANDSVLQYDTNDNQWKPVAGTSLGTDTDTNNYANSLSFNTSNGVLTVGRSGLGDLTVDLDNRYATSVPTNNNQLTNGAGYITSSGTASNANNVKIRTDNGSAWHYPLFVDSNSDNQNQTIKVDASGMKYYPSLGWLQCSGLQSFIMYDWNASSGSAGQVLTSQGGSQWNWTTINQAASFLGKTKITIKTSGSGSHTTESWCKTCWAIIQGGGGAGGSARSGTAQGGRGGHGGMQVNYQNDLTVATVFPYSVGAGGARHGGGGNCDDAIQSGGNGGSSYFGPTNNRGTAAGGTGGAGAYDGQIGANGTDGGLRFFASDYGAGGQGGTWTGGDGCNNTSEAGQGGAIFILELG